MENQPTPPNRKHRILKVFLLVLAFFAITFGIAFYLTYGRPAKEGYDLWKRTKAAMKNGEPLVGARPAREVFSPEFLQSVFGDNPALLFEVRQHLQKAAEENPAMMQDDISMLAADYEPGPQGQPTHVVLYWIGNLQDPRQPKVKEDGFVRTELGSKELFQLSKSMLAIAGHEIQIYGEPAAAQEHRAAVNAVMNLDNSKLETLLQRKHHLRGVIVNPGLLMPESVRNEVKFITCDVVGSLKGTDTTLTIITTSENASADVKSLLSHWQTLVLAALHTRAPSPNVRCATDTLSHTTIETNGSSVTARGEFNSQMMDFALRVVRATARAFWTVRLAPPPDNQPK